MLLSDGGSIPPASTKQSRPDFTVWAAFFCIFSDFQGTPNLLPYHICNHLSLTLEARQCGAKTLKKGSVKSYAQICFWPLVEIYYRGRLNRPLVTFQQAGRKGSRAAVRRLPCP